MPDEVWAAFSTAGFTCWPRTVLSDGGADLGAVPLVVRPAPPGTASGPFPFSGPATFLTADNPHGREVPAEENASRRVRLVEALDELRLSWMPAEGGDPDGDHREPGAVVLGLDLTTSAELGARFEQAAVYVWTPTALHLVACQGDRHEALGYVVDRGRPGHLPIPPLA